MYGPLRPALRASRRLPAHCPQRLSEIDKLPVPECPVCKEIKALDQTVAVDFTPDVDLIDAIEAEDTARTIVEWPIKSPKETK